MSKTKKTTKIPIVTVEISNRDDLPNFFVYPNDDECAKGLLTYFNKLHKNYPKENTKYTLAQCLKMVQTGGCLDDPHCAIEIWAPGTYQVMIKHTTMCVPIKLEKC